MAAWQLKVAMLVIFIIALACGAVLSACKYKVFSLIPITFAGWFFIAAAGMIHGSSTPSVLLAMLAVCIGLQTGYAIGFCARWAGRGERAPVFELPRRVGRVEIP